LQHVLPRPQVGMMEGPMQQLRLEELMRYVLAGAIGLVALVLGFLDISKPVGAVPGVTEVGLLLFVTLALGSVVYAVHRALLYPLLYHMALLVLVLCGVYALDVRLFLPFFPAPLEVKLDVLRWKRGRDHYAQPRIAEWAAQVHFLYCSGWAMLSVLWLGLHLGLRPAPARVTLLWIAGSVLAIGFVSNCRLLYFDSLTARHEAPELAGRNRVG
jgi:hypothetical protein